MSDNRYYISSFFWTAAAKLLNALLGLVSVPLLLGYFGKASFGILGIATSCNAYMHLLDLGMNTGAVKFYSQWKAEGRRDLSLKVAHTNLSFYSIIAAINILVLVLLALFGDGLFAVSHEQFLTLRSCLFIIAGFSLFSWVTTAFNQLLVADRQMAFTMKAQCVQVLLKAALIAIVLMAKLSLLTYFFFLTMILAGLVVPYAWKARKDGLIDSLRPEWHGPEFRTVLLFSLSIFALAIFQTTATESRPIVLSICANDGADAVADFRILWVVPSLILTIGTSFSTIFLPRSAELVARKDQEGIERFAYKWTGWTSILANLLCVPFILCAGEVLTAYVGSGYARLAPWLALWCLTILLQVHTTPGNSLVIAYGRTRQLVLTTAAACLVSIVLNVLLCRQFGVGSAIIGYLVYVVLVVGLYYIYYYKKLMRLSRLRMLLSFLKPTLLAFALLALVWLIPFDGMLPESLGERWGSLLVCVVKTLVWLLPYAALLFLFGLLRPGDFREMKK